MSFSPKNMLGAQHFNPEFVDVKQEPADDYEMADDQNNQNKEESSEHKFDPLSNIKVEYDNELLNVASTSSSSFTVPVKQEVLSDEENSMDMDTSQEWADLNSDGENSSISISDNLDDIKQESSSQESSDDSSEEDDDGDDYLEEVEEDSDDETADPLRRCLNILKTRPNIVLDTPEIAILLLLLLRRRRRNQPKIKRRCWTLSDNSDRIARLNFEKKFAQRRENHKQFLYDFNMSVKTFDELLEKISHRIKRKDTNMRYAISPAERLAATIRYLVSGYSYTQLLDEFDIGKTTISGIVKLTTEIIWQELKKEYMPAPTKEEFLKIADKFYEKTEFPNCLGSICSKYVKVIVPKSKESEFDRHNKYFATAILAIVDSDMNFIDISVGVLGNSNDNFLVKSPIGRKITKGLFDMPEPKPLFDPGPKVPYVFVSKDSLNTNIMKPYSKSSDEKKLIFNRRLEKAHMIAEDCLQMVAYKWRVLRRGIGHHTYAEHTIKTICILHNFVSKKEGVTVGENERWILDAVPSCGMRGTAQANQVRENFTNYFVSPQGSVSWQYVKPQSIESKPESEVKSGDVDSEEVNGKKIETDVLDMETEVDKKEMEVSKDVDLKEIETQKENVEDQSTDKEKE